MTLESAIKHVEQVAVREDNNAQVYDKIKNDNLYHPDKITCEQAAKRCRECAAEHRQLAEWLKELKERREKDVPDTNVGDMISRQVAIDALCKRCDLVNDDTCGEKCIDIKILEKLSSAQPDIIHCRECKNCQIDSVFHDYWCDGRKVWKDHYCGYAERRTDG